MGITLGISLLLLTGGAVLGFGLEDGTTNDTFDLKVTGWILMGAGAVGIVSSMINARLGRNAVTTETVVTADRSGNGHSGDGHAGSDGEPNYEKWTKEDLVSEARERDIEGRSQMDKSELIRAIRRDSEH